MKRLLLALVVVAFAPAIVFPKVPPEEQPPFQPVHAVSVTDIEPPSFAASEGTVVLNALISETGKVERVEVRRDLGHFSKLAAQAVEDWEFSPATKGDKAIASRIPVAVTFRPPVSFAEPVPLPTLIPQSEAAIQAEFQPAEVLHAEFPRYPPDTTVSGTVVLEAVLNAEGKAKELRVLRDIPPLTEEAKAVVEKWRFIPATLNGHPVESRIVLVFLFPPLYLGPEPW